MKYLAIFKRVGTIPNPFFEDGWISISLEAGSIKQARKWALYRVKKLEPWLKYRLDLFRVERYKLSLDTPGIYRGLVIDLG